MTPVFINAFTATSCAGNGNIAFLDALESGRSGLSSCAFDNVDLPTWIGKVEGLDLDSAALPAELSRFECRNNRLAWLGLQQDGFDALVRESIRTVGTKRVGLFLGTSTSGIYETELAFRDIEPTTGQFRQPISYSGSHSVTSLSNFICALYGIEGPAFVISTACSSSAKVFATAQRFLDLGLIDLALVGGVDSLCLTTLYGFNSLQLTSEAPCRPYDLARNGISIGEAAAFALLSRQPLAQSLPRLQLLGYGESSDAFHMSSPHPEGLGARKAMNAALEHAGLQVSDIDYINLHGTATPSNDRAEGLAVNTLFGDHTACSSTKGITGHTLGAAGAVEAVASCLALTRGLIPGSPGTRTLDPDIHLNYQMQTSTAPISRVLSNSFGFGGSNCSLLFGVSR